MTNTINMKKCFVMGLPEAGKTTYIAALSYVLLNSSASVLRIKELVGDSTYFSEMSSKWSNVEKLPRTLPATERINNEFRLINNQGDELALIIPDLSGESFQEQYINRTIKTDHAELIKECMGILFFLNPDNIIEATLISKLSTTIRSGEEVKTRNAKDHDLTQVQLVDLLQFISYLRDGRPLRLCVIVSAWDVIEVRNKKPKPEEFIQKRVPLLWQFIKSNSHIFEENYFGVSAQGGKLEDAEKLLGNIDACDRIQVVDKDGNISKDITLPINWLMDT